MPECESVVNSPDRRFDSVDFATIEARVLADMLAKRRGNSVVMDIETDGLDRSWRHHPTMIIIDEAHDLTMLALSIINPAVTVVPKDNYEPRDITGKLTTYFEDDEAFRRLFVIDTPLEDEHARFMEQMEHMLPGDKKAVQQALTSPVKRDEFNRKVSPAEMVSGASNRRLRRADAAKRSKR